MDDVQDCLFVFLCFVLQFVLAQNRAGVEFRFLATFILGILFSLPFYVLEIFFNFLGVDSNLIEHYQMLGKYLNCDFRVGDLRSTGICMNHQHFFGLN